MSEGDAMGGADESGFERIYREILDREARGEPAPFGEYAARYPWFADRLRVQEEVHRALNAVATWSLDDESSGDRGERGPVALHTPSALPRLPGYEVVRELGRGGMGVVYEAVQERLGRRCAVKAILAGDLAGREARARFLKEAEIVARFEHPNIVRVHAAGEHEGRPFVELEYAAGGSLAARLDGTPRPAAEAARLVEALARAMHYAHERGVVHRDLKPANVLIAGDGTPKVADFGLAKLLEADGPDAEAGGITRTGAVLGTPSYMAPEQAEGRGRVVGPAADVYALGAILYEMLVGRAPFRGATPLETLVQVRTLDPPAPRSLRPGLPRDLEAICLKCLEKEPAGRYADARALADDLARHLAGEPVLARPSGSIARMVRSLGRGQYDKEFGRWAPLVLYVFCPAIFLAHTSVFVMARLGSPHLALALRIPQAALAVLLAIAVAVYRSGERSEPSLAVRLLASIIVGQVAATLTALAAHRLMSAPAGPLAPLAFYPLCASAMGAMFLSLGGAFWSGFYPSGLACFVAAPLMAADLTFAPLEFAAIVTSTFLALGLHLRGLDARARARGEVS